MKSSKLKSVLQKMHLQFQELAEVIRTQIEARMDAQSRLCVFLFSTPQGQKLHLRLAEETFKNHIRPKKPLSETATVTLMFDSIEKEIEVISLLREPSFNKYLQDQLSVYLKVERIDQTLLLSF